MRLFGPDEPQTDPETGPAAESLRRSLGARLRGRVRSADPDPAPAPEPEPARSRVTHPPVIATYDPRVPGPDPMAAGVTGPDRPDAQTAPPARDDPPVGRPTPETRPAPDAHPARSSPRPAARLISRPDHAAPPQPAARPEPPAREATALAPAPQRRRIWDIPAGPDAAPRAAPPEAREQADRPAGPSPEEVEIARAHLSRIASPSAAAPRSEAGGGTDTARARTRVLGFQGRDLAGDDPRDRPPATATRAGPSCPVGWIVVTGGPGRGASFTLVAGVSSIGRGADQAIALDFGDLAISRENHASIVYDDRDDRFLLGHGGKANLVRLNGRPVVSTEDLADGDEISIGDTVLRFVAFCGTGFVWTRPEGTGAEGSA